MVMPVRIPVITRRLPGVRPEGGMVTFEVAMLSSSKRFEDGHTSAPLGSAASRTPITYSAFVTGEPPDHATRFDSCDDHVAAAAGADIVGYDANCVAETE